ncbi:MAG: hypothetical protein U0792_12685 [Gemmataceae bacterium]
MERTQRVKAAIVSLLTILATAPPALALEPQVEFLVKDGWVSMMLTRDGKPIPEAAVC